MHPVVGSVIELEHTDLSQTAWAGIPSLLFISYTI